MKNMTLALCLTYNGWSTWWILLAILLMMGPKDG